MDAAERRTEKRPQSRTRRARTRTKLKQTATQDVGPSTAENHGISVQGVPCHVCCSALGAGSPGLCPNLQHLQLEIVPEVTRSLVGEQLASTLSTDHRTAVVSRPEVPRTAKYRCSPQGFQNLADFCSHNQ
ncbi:hypothetical protein RRG08_010690 [Elysia crispata]|uniref:Uncharacterized protein n=1 Tax=Elysia crispata TaxID=231223 RepID=A0AAE1D5Z6_9GAST|nr:hypothetical protein RRG08_010690 [Elysia crispata]